jgi:hypothetical protein
MSKYIKEWLEPIVKKSLSWAQVCRELGLKPATGSQSHIKKVSIDLNIDFSHFKGSAWNKGRTFLKRNVKEYLFLGCTEPSHRIKEKLIRDGLKEKKCEFCSISTWKEKDLPLELDHKNGNHLDNRLENLQILCPNCHSIKTREDRIKKARLSQSEEDAILEIV